MHDSLSYSIGRFFGRRPGVTALTIIAAIVAGVLIYGPTDDPAPDAQRIANAIDIQTKQIAQTVCQRTRADKLTEYQASLAVGEPGKAATALRDCATTLQDAELQALVTKAERQDALSIARNTKAEPQERQRAIDRIEPLDLQDAAEFAKLRKTISIAEEKAKKSAARAEAVRKRSQGVSIGMTPEDVRASSWGKPERVNRSTYSFGVREQWVYGSGHYLYFRDGVLNSIQTAN